MEWNKITVVCFFLCVYVCSAMSLNEIEDFSNFLKMTSQLDVVLKKGTSPDDELDEDEPASDHAWEDSGKFEGDLVLNDRQRRLIVENVAEGLSRNGLKDGTKRWPNNEVIYYIQREHFSGDQVQAIEDGIGDLAQASCVKFRPYRKGDRDAVVIQGSRRGCFSQVGYQGGYQVLNLSGRHPVGRGCFRHGTVVHEFLHTLGFYHMQSSPDRDDYINVLWENIIEPAKHNFRKYNSFSVSDFGVGYDYDSVLHYSRRAFSSNGRDTLVPKQGGASIGQRSGLSDKDTQKLNKMYCDADSNNFNADEATTQKSPTKKKTPKNKPFEGHGIGYHQGKTVVIKLPAAETYKLPDLPTSHVFDYFSKTPQAVLPTIVQGLGIGKEIGYLYKPPPASESDEYRKQLDNNTYKLNYKELTPTISYDVYEDNKDEELTKSSINDHMDDMKNLSLVYQHSTPDTDNTDEFSEETDEVDNDGLNDAFERLGKIIKTHVYPSNTPKFGLYNFKKDYSEFYKPKKQLEAVIEKEDTAVSSKKEIKNYDLNMTLNELFRQVNKNNYEKEKKPARKFESSSRSDTQTSEELDLPFGSSYPEDLHKLKDIDLIKSLSDDEQEPDEGDPSYDTSYPLKEIHKIIDNKLVKLSSSNEHVSEKEPLYDRPYPLKEMHKVKNSKFLKVLSNVEQTSEEEDPSHDTSYPLEAIHKVNVSKSVKPSSNTQLTSEERNPPYDTSYPLKEIHERKHNKPAKLFSNDQTSEELDLPYDTSTSKEMQKVKDSESETTSSNIEQTSKEDPSDDASYPLKQVRKGKVNKLVKFTSNEEKTSKEDDPSHDTSYPPKEIDEEKDNRVVKLTLHDKQISEEGELSHDKLYPLKESIKVKDNKFKKLSFSDGQASKESNSPYDTSYLEQIRKVKDNELLKSLSNEEQESGEQEDSPYDTSYPLNDMYNVKNNKFVKISSYDEQLSEEEYPSHETLYPFNEIQKVNDIKLLKPSLNIKQASEEHPSRDTTHQLKETQVEGHGLVKSPSDDENTFEKEDDDILYHLQEIHKLRNKKIFKPSLDEKTGEEDSLYNILYPLLKFRQVKDDKVVTPKHDTIKYLSDDQNYSSLRSHTKNNNKALAKEKHALFGYVIPLDDDWYNKDDNVHSNERIYNEGIYETDKNSSDHENNPKRLQRQQPHTEDEEDTAYNPPSLGKKVYSLTGVLVPLSESWFKVHYDPHKSAYSIEKLANYDNR